MDERKTSQNFTIKLDTLEKLSERTRLLPPWLFRHDDLLKSFESARTLNQKNLINAINYIHFSDGHLFVLLQHPFYDEYILLKAQPEPCQGKEVFCRWIEKDLPNLNLRNFRFQYLIISNSQAIILIPARLRNIDGDGIVIDLEKEGYSVDQRQTKRYQCYGVTAELNQNGFLATGNLLDFNPLGFRININSLSQRFFNWFNPDQQIIINLYRDQNVIFSGPCRTIRRNDTLKEREIVLAPVNDVIYRFKKKEIRNPRRQLIPSPFITFEHPFFKKKVQREIKDIANLGFSVHESAHDAVLLPGMIIPDLTIIFHGFSKIKCLGQVIYRQEKQGSDVLCGFAILDMNIESYSRLTHIISNMLDPHAYLCQEVDTDNLWEFFFESGFLYPEKYNHIYAYRQNFKEVYEKLYRDSPEIARHFTYEKNGRIFAHISMVKAYTRSWFIHHHAATAMENKLTGFRILKQITHYFNGVSRLPSSKTDYALCYYRPDNEFPDLVFGGFTRELNNLKGSSLDLFSYKTYPTNTTQTPLPDGWTLAECTAFDLWKLERFYQHRSGGLLLKAICIQEGKMVDDDLEKQYQRIGFTRKCEAYSLNFQEELKAILIVEQSSPGLNLSELINGIKVLVTKPETLSWAVLSLVISRLIGVFHYPEVPLLIYPAEYTQLHNIPYEKQYQMWILNIRDNIDEYCDFMSRKFRMRFK